ncbi:hypothetical protein ABEM51_21740 [Escherichia coli]
MRQQQDEPGRFSICSRQAAVVQADIQKAKSYGVNGTPATFVVDNQTGKSQLLGGAQPAQAIMAVMRKMMIESQQDDSANQ